MTQREGFDQSLARPQGFERVVVDEQHRVVGWVDEPPVDGTVDAQLRLDAEAREPGRAERIVAEEAVEVGARHPPVGADAQHRGQGG